MSLAARIWMNGHRADETDPERFAAHAHLHRAIGDHRADVSVLTAGEIMNRFAEHMVGVFLREQLLEIVRSVRLGKHVIGEINRVLAIRRRCDAIIHILSPFKKCARGNRTHICFYSLQSSFASSLTT